jgi:hypothetical protein
MEFSEMSPIINIRDLIQEMDGLSDNFKSFLNIRTGEFIMLSDEEMGAAEEGDPLEDYHDWHQEVIQIACDVLSTDDNLALPSQYDIHEYEIMKRFCYTVEDDELRDRLLYRISGRGAFRIFKDTIYEHEITDDWYEYRYQAFKEIAKNWLESHNIAYTGENED